MRTPRKNLTIIIENELLQKSRHVIHTGVRIFFLCEYVTSLAKEFEMPMSFENLGQVSY